MYMRRERGLVDRKSGTGIDVQPELSDNLFGRFPAVEDGPVVRADEQTEIGVGIAVCEFLQRCDGVGGAGQVHLYIAVSKACLAFDGQLHHAGACGVVEQVGL